MISEIFVFLKPATTVDKQVKSSKKESQYSIVKEQGSSFHGLNKEQLK